MDILLISLAGYSVLFVVAFSVKKVWFVFFQMITREMFEDALKDLQDDGVIIVMGKSTIRVCWTKFFMFGVHAAHIGLMLDIEDRLEYHW